MLQKVEFINPGDSGMLKDEQLYKLDFDELNDHLLADGKKPATANPVFLQLDAGAVGKHAQGLREIDGLGLHDEIEEVASFAAAEAVPELLFATDGEARRFLGVEGTETDVLLTLTVQANVSRDHLDYVEAILHILFGVPSGHPRD